MLVKYLCYILQLLCLDILSATIFTFRTLTFLPEVEYLLRNVVELIRSQAFEEVSQCKYSSRLELRPNSVTSTILVSLMLAWRRSSVRLKCLTIDVKLLVNLKEPMDCLALVVLIIDDASFNQVLEEAFKLAC